MKKNYFLLLILTLLAMFPPFSIDMYLPAFKNIELSLNASFFTVQLTLSIFLFGYAFSQLLFGPLSDRYGRKPILLFGIILYIIFSLLCAFIPSIHAFYFARLIQAIGAGSSAVISFAIIKDLFEHEQRVFYLSAISAMMGLAPIIAPIIGGYITVLIGWRYIFVFLACMGIIAFSGVTKVPESLPYKNYIDLQLLKNNYYSLLKNRKFTSPALSCAFAFSSMFAFISSSPRMYIHLFNVEQNHFGYLFAINAFSFMLGNFISAKFIGKFSSILLNRLGAMIILIGGILLFSSTLLFNSIYCVIIPMLIATLGVGMTIPSAIANAMSQIDKQAGLASSLISFFQFGLAALTSFIVSQIYFGNALPLGVMVIFGGLVATLFSL